MVRPIEKPPSRLEDEGLIRSWCHHHVRRRHRLRLGQFVPAHASWARIKLRRGNGRSRKRLVAACAWARTAFTVRLKGVAWSRSAVRSRTKFTGSLCSADT